MLFAFSDRRGGGIDTSTCPVGLSGDQAAAGSMHTLLFNAHFNWVLWLAFYDGSIPAPGIRYSHTISPSHGLWRSTMVYAC